MGIHLRPGHKVEKGKSGWVSTRYEDFLSNIKIGTIDLGYWGNRIVSNELDGHSPIYSIPNPWASAYLFNFVLSDNTNPLAEYLIIELLNLLTEYAIFRTAELIELRKPEANQPFFKFWQMAPNFIKYNDSIYFFRSKSTGKILGGLSQSTLVWTSQLYVSRQTKDELLRNKELILYLHRIKETKYPNFTETNFNTFWQHPLLANLLAERFNEIEIELEKDPLSPKEWLKLVKSKILESEFFDEDSGCYVFDEFSLNMNRRIFEGRENPPNLTKELLQKKSGSSIPLNLGEVKWVILDSLLEPYWINQKKVEYSSSEEVRALEKGFLYPVKPEYLKEFKLKLSELKLNGNMQIGESNALADLLWKEKRNVRLNTRFFYDNRSIAIWPPFKSEYINNYVFEYDIDGINKLEKLEFYDENGGPIEYIGPIYHENQNFRIYKLEMQSFPKYIRVVKRGNGNLFGGFIEIIERKKANVQGEITIGIDFGTSHTAIAYRKGNASPQLMNFQNSKPIFITDSQSKFGLTYNFLPPGLLDSKPSNKKEWGDHVPWQPFQTQWMDFSKGMKKFEDLQFIEDGNIPFLYYAGGSTAGNPIKENLKWGAPLDVNIYRTLFLKQLFLMVLVEMEAIGFENLNILWSYPKAFSTSQYLVMRTFWNGILQDLNLEKSEN